MSKTIVPQLFSQSLQLQKLRKSIADPQIHFRLKGLTGSALSFAIKDAFKDAGAPFLLILNDKEEAAYHLNDLEQLVGESDVLF